MLTKDAILNKDYKKLLNVTGADIIFLFGSVLSDNFLKEIFISKFDHIKRYYDEVVYKNIAIFIEFYGKYLKILAENI